MNKKTIFMTYQATSDIELIPAYSPIPRFRDSSNAASTDTHYDGCGGLGSRKTFDYQINTSMNRHSAQQ
jgi:hypothetical protein